MRTSGVPLRIRAVVGLAAAALAGWFVLNRTPIGAPVWTAVALHAVAVDSPEAARVAGDRAVLLGPSGSRWLVAGFARWGVGDRPGARQAFLAATMARDEGVRRDGYHALSALHLEEAGLGRPGPVTESPTSARSPGSAAAAARAAMEGLRLDPGHPGLVWNLYLARRVGGFPEPDRDREPLDPAMAASLRAGLASLEARALRESLAQVVQALETERDPQPTEGPPW